MVIVASELVAAFIIWRVWRSANHVAHKIAISLLSVVPVFGPFFAWWLQHDPGPAHHTFRDRQRYRTDVHDRWRHVFDETNPVARFRKWRNLMSSRSEDKP
jgi:hypothetical protein